MRVKRLRPEDAADKAARSAAQADVYRDLAADMQARYVAAVEGSAACDVYRSEWNRLMGLRDEFAADAESWAETAP